MSSAGLKRTTSVGGAVQRARLWEIGVPARALRQAWHFFTSVRLALILILAITAAVLAGTLIDQAPPSVIADSESYAQWLERARDRYGVWTDVFRLLDLFNVFHTFWFRALIGLLTANIIVCSINRWKGIWTTVFRTRTRMGEAFFEHARFGAGWSAAMPAATAADRVRRALGRSRYRVKLDPGGDSVAIYADRNRFSRFGTFFSHLSIVLILVGAIVGSVWGFSDDEFIVSEGERRDVGMGTGISVELDHFVDEYWLEGPPKDFRSDIIIYDNGVEAKRGTVRVNSPLSYKGVRFHQAFFGQSAMMKVEDADGTVLFDDGVALAWLSRDRERPVGFFPLPERNLDIYVIGSVSGVNDPVVPAGEMRIEAYRQDSGRLLEAENLIQGTPKEIQGLSFTFQREKRFTGLKVVKDPGVNIIWAASGLMVLGLVMLFYFPHRRFWALCQQRPDGTADVRLGTTAQRDLALAEEFKRLRKRVGLALGISQDDKEPDEGGGDV